MDIRKVPDSNGRFYIYSISENIAQKKVGTKGNQNGRLLKAVPTYGNNISQSNNTVKSSTSVKHSIEENNNKTWREYLEENYEATGTRTYMPDHINDDYDFAIDEIKDNKRITLVDVDDQGRTLTKEQIKYFKNSKVRDKEDRTEFEKINKLRYNNSTNKSKSGVKNAKNYGIALMNNMYNSMFDKQ